MTDNDDAEQAMRSALPKGPEQSSSTWAPVLVAHLRAGNDDGVRAVIADVGVEAVHPATGTTPLHYVALSGTLDVFDELVAGGANPRSCNNDGWSAFVFAAYGGHSAILTRVVDLVGVPDSPELASALSCVTSARGKVVPAEGGGRDHVGVARLLLSYGASPNELMRGPGPTTSDETIMSRLLAKACSDSHHDDLVAVLLEHGGDPEARSPHSRAPMLRALAAGRTDLAELLFASGARCGDSGPSPLHALAEANAHRESFDQWTKRGCDVDALDPHGRSAARIAAEKGHLDALRALIALGATLNSLDEAGWNLLTLARIDGNEETAELLAGAGVAKQPEFSDAIEAASSKRASLGAGRVPGKISGGAFKGYLGFATPAGPDTFDVVIEIFGKEKQVTINAADFDPD